MTTLISPEIAAPEVTPQIIAPHQSTPQYQDVPHKWLISARDFARMTEAGFFEHQRVELIGGDIITMPPISETHAQSLDKITKKLNKTLDDALVTRNQNSFDAGENNRPQPDIAIVRAADLSLHSPPSQALLIIEFSKTTLAYDRSTKLSLYASIGIPDYWIVNLNNNTVEVYRQPIESQEMEFGWDYASRVIYQRSQSVTILEVPEVSIAVDDVLP